MQITLESLAEKISAQLQGDSSPMITGVNSIDAATKDELTFVSAAKHVSKLANSNAAAVIVNNPVDTIAIPQLIVKNVDAALIAALKIFAPKLIPQEGIHPTAVIEDTAKIGENVSLGPGVYIGHNAVIEANSIISPGCNVGQNSKIGQNTRLDANVVVYHDCKIGSNCIIMANSTIGATGFGYSFLDGRHQLIPHNGGVIIGDCVEIGANSCIDRAKFGNTVIGAGTKMDNLVQIGHNCIIGRCCLMASQVGLSGSCQLGDGVVFGGQSGMADNYKVGSGTIVAARGAVISDLPPGMTVMGHPAQEVNKERRKMVAQNRLPDTMKKLKVMEKRIRDLEEKSGN
jgi:UDP-3-O-[3-hydroxymyristoyl] glucosamine N-acyltransferase